MRFGLRDERSEDISLNQEYHAHRAAWRPVLKSRNWPRNGRSSGPQGLGLGRWGGC